MHHGSGPPTTSLLDPEMATKLAAYAGEVARRYPWIDAYTPVNEPHTTARFACRYGIWFPHHQSERSFLTALMNQNESNRTEYGSDPDGESACAIDTDG